MIPVTRIGRPLLAGLAGAVVTLAGCSGSPGAADASSPASSPSSPPGTSASPETPAVDPTAAPTAASTPDPSESASSAPAEEAAKPVAGVDLAGHIHNLGYDGRRLLIGTHEGLWAQDPGSDPTQASKDAFDVMGFTVAGDRWLASGHPGEGMDAPQHLGLLESTDNGRTWSEVALGGDVDFHRLVTSGTVILGVNSVDGALLRSDDAGAAWDSLGTPGLYDLAVSPDDASIVAGTTENGPVRSTDGGVTFASISGTPLLALLAWTGAELYAVDVDGRLHHSSDAGLTWTERGSVGGQPIALAASGATIAALVDDVIVESVDGGETFTPRITDIAGH